MASKPGEEPPPADADPPPPEPEPEPEPAPSIGDQIKKVAILYGIGGMAGAIETLMAIPLDAIKLRVLMQSSGKESKKKCGNLIEAMYRICHTKGALGFYADLKPELTANIPKKAALFSTYESILDLIPKTEDGATLPAAPFAAGLVAGLAEGLAANPFENIKLNANLMQHQSPKQEYPSMGEVYGKLIKSGFGSKGLNKGLHATLLRFGVFNTCYFGFYQLLKPSICNKGSGDDEPGLDASCTFTTAFVSGAIGAVAAAPFEVVQMRIQAPEGCSKYQGPIQTLKAIQKQEGLSVLWRGLMPRILRYGIGGGILMVAYESLKLKYYPVDPPKPEPPPEEPPPPPEGDPARKRLRARR